MKSKVDIKKLVGDDPLEALVYLEKIHAKDSNQTFNLILLLQSQFNDLKKAMNGGVISPSDANMTLNQIKLNIFSIIDDTKDEFFEPTDVKNNQENGETNYLIILEIQKLIRDLTDFSIELSKHANPETYSTVSGFMNTKREVVLNQLVKLIRISNFELSVTDYKVIGDAFSKIFDYQSAEEYYKNAINKVDVYTDSSISKVKAIRTYANFLYTSGRDEEGLKLLETAILQNNSDLSNLLNGYTCSLIFINESNIEKFDNALVFYKKAENYYSQLKNNSAKNYWLSDLESKWAKNKPKTAK